MFSIRKFYDAAQAESPASTNFSIGEQLNLEEVLNTPEPSPKEETLVIEEKKEEPEVKQPEIKDEVKTPVVEEKKVETPVAPQPPDWREVIKGVDRKELHKHLEIDEEALGVSKELASDEFVKKLLTYRKENGNVTPFLEAATKDWKSVSHIDLLKDDLRRQYPTLSQDKFDILVRANIDKRFVLGEDADPEEAKLAEVLLETEGEKVRAQRIAEQQTFLDSVKPVDRDAEVKRLAQEKSDADAREFQLFKEMVDANPSIVKLMTEKKIVIGEGENAYNLSVNPDTVKEQILDSNKFFSQFWGKDEKGQPVLDANRLARVFAFANDPNYDNNLIEHGKSLATKEIVEKKMGNTSVATTTKPSDAGSKSLAKTFETEAESFTLDKMY